MSGALPPLPLPDRLPDDLPTETLEAGETLFRFHGAQRDPVFFGPPPGVGASSRFDDPAGRFGVLYAGRDVAAAFAETFVRIARAHVLPEREVAARRLSVLVPTRELRLVSLHGPGLAALGLDARIASGDHGAARAWSAALFAHPSAPDGLCWRCRHDDAAFAVALFRRGEDAPVRVEGRARELLAEPAVLGPLLARYRLGLW